MQARPERPRLAWAITGSGHYLEECLEIIRDLEEVDIFYSRAGEEVIRMYGHNPKSINPNSRYYHDRAASAPPVGLFYRGDYHTLVVAPATSNTVAKMVLGLSDTLVTNVFAQAGKCRIPAIVLACDTEQQVDTPAPDREVRLWPRKIDLQHTENLRSFEATTVVESASALKHVLEQRLATWQDDHA
ncbi:Archaeal flavoprotein [Methylophaga frappieri]|uniref:Archaeal flavoprotein n=1 Tax=Methylophaga frappieri (strain ATCC BAA-2434 / DSM 25690 / JAM7) TaxID=754477 RepID=I1YJP4_METFJ|nr:flavoprotein [Methylophaga frappieri]AFJ03137.1 Archaeal flavoprotein [Methylophaga frappieri]